MLLRKLKDRPNLEIQEKLGETRYLELFRHNMIYLKKYIYLLELLLKRTF